MMIIISEYLFCLLYATGLFICIYPYLKKKKNYFFYICFLLLYGFIDFIITGDYFLEFYDYLISNTLVIISDFLMIAESEGTVDVICIAGDIPFEDLQELIGAAASE